MFRLFWKDAGDFVGTVTYEGFSLIRIISYSNSFNPVINGQFITEQDGVRIDLTATLHPFVAVLMSFLYLLLIYATIFSERVRKGARIETTDNDSA